LGLGVWALEFRIWSLRPRGLEGEDAGEISCYSGFVFRVSDFVFRFFCFFCVPCFVFCVQVWVRRVGLRVEG
jgi:hypothetical protein